MMGMASIGRWSIETREPPALSRTLGGGLSRIDSVAYGYGPAPHGPQAAKPATPAAGGRQELKPKHSRRRCDTATQLDDPGPPPKRNAKS